MKRPPHGNDAWSSSPFRFKKRDGYLKVISEHSTIGLVLTTDGSIAYRDQIMRSLKNGNPRTAELGKPQVALNPQPESQEGAGGFLKRKIRRDTAYRCLRMTRADIINLFRVLLSSPCGNSACAS